MGKKNLAYDYYQAPPFDVILDPEAQRGRWRHRFGREAPLHVEIGMGLGQYLLAFARAHPEYNHLGVEAKMHRIYTARQKALKAGVRHLRFVLGDAERAVRALADGEAARITILFSDPWPNAKDEDKRLAAPRYVAQYRRALAPGGVVHLRSDDPDFYAYAARRFREAGFALTEAVELARPLTGFEERWLAAGKAIYGFDAVLGAPAEDRAP